MRAPGFRGLKAPDQDASLPWLAQQMVTDPRFALGTVEFWWPAVMGTEVLRAPEDPSLPGYDDQLMAFNLQRQEMGRLASEFSQGGFRLKALLRSMVHSKWFQLSGIPDDHPYAAVLLSSGLSVGRLLTPEELEAKTSALLGITVGHLVSDWILPTESSYLSSYGVALGGIDSYQVQKRSRGISALAAVVTSDHSYVAASTVVEVDRETENGHRILLDDVDFTQNPADSELLRSVMVRLYAELHGKRYDIESESVNLAMELLLEAFSLPDYDSSRWIGHQTGQETERLMNLTRERGFLRSDDRYRSPEEFQNTLAWRLVLDYFLSHFDYVHD